MSRVTKNGKPNIHIRLTDPHLWRAVKAQAALESVPVGTLVERALKRLIFEDYGPTGRTRSGKLYRATRQP